LEMQSQLSIFLMSKENINMKKILAVPLLSIGLSMPAMTLGSPIGPGFDLFTTMPGTEVKIPIPPPGSGEIVVKLKGNPTLLPSILSGKGTDTIVERKQGIDPFVPPAGVGTIDIELVALSLKSTDSFDGTPLGLPGMVDLYVTVNKASSLPIPFPNLPQPCTTLSDSTGSMTVKHTVDDGGTFSSRLTVDACLSFVIPGGNVNNPSDILTSMPHSDITPASDRTLTSTDVPWSHTAPPPPWPGTPSDFPSGEFYPIPPEENIVAASVLPHNNHNSWIFWELALLMKHGVRLEATDVTLNVSKNGNKVNLTLTTSSEPNAAEFLILRGDKLDNGGTAMNTACSFASKGVASSYTCTDNVVGDTYRVLEKEYDGRVILYDEVKTP
jgi:hypothetical protein